MDPAASEEVTSEQGKGREGTIWDRGRRAKLGVGETSFLAPGHCGGPGVCPKWQVPQGETPSIMIGI